MLDGLTKGLNGGRAKVALEVAKDQDVGEVMTAYAKEQGTRLI